MMALTGAAPDLLVISVVTPDSPVRHVARMQLRTAVREVLGLQLDCAPDSIVLASRPGQAIRVDLPRHGIGIGLSVSHEAGLSVAAIHRCGPVGIDILRLPQEFDWQPVARDYLGPQVLARMAALPTDQQPPAFAHEWTRLEAGLKCLGVGLQEWNPSLEKRLKSCRLARLKLPAGLFGAVALPLK